jgi:hypothetical protein
MIVCAAVIGQQVRLASSSCGFVEGGTSPHDSRLQNQPLYLRTFVPTEDEVKFHYIVHCSLDAVEEKGTGCWVLDTSSICFAIKKANGIKC